MFIDGQKALVISSLPNTCSKLKKSLPYRYNLKVKTVKDCDQAIALIDGQSRPFEVVIVDDHRFDLIECADLYLSVRHQCPGTSMFYLSTLKEWEGASENTDPAAEVDRIEQSRRVELASMRLHKMTELCRPLFHNTLAKGIYQDICRRMVDIFNVEYGIVALKDTVEEYRVVIVEQFPRTNTSGNRFFQMEFHQQPEFEELLKYYRPIHISSASEMETIGQPFEKPLGVKPDSFLLVPLVCRGRSIGFTGLFNRRPTGVFNLEEMDLCLRFTDTLARSFCRGLTTQSR